MTARAKHIVENILETLLSQRELKHAWLRIDDDRQEALTEQMEQIVEKTIKLYGSET